eukprot:1160778-Pelagomonas_calceolata.AAC.2
MLVFLLLLLPSMRCTSWHLPPGLMVRSMRSMHAPPITFEEGGTLTSGRFHVPMGTHGDWSKELAGQQQQELSACHSPPPDMQKFEGSLGKYCCSGSCDSDIVKKDSLHLCPQLNIHSGA